MIRRRAPDRRGPRDRAERDKHRHAQQAGPPAQLVAARAAEVRRSTARRAADRAGLLEVQAKITRALESLTFAWTGWSAAAELAPFMTQLPVLHLRVGEAHARRDIEPAVRDAGLTITDHAGRVELWRSDADAFIYAAASERGPLCSWPRVYADLVRIGGRGVDAAEHLRDVMKSDR